MVSICKCGKARGHWTHQVAHPSTRGRAEVHEFVSVGTPVVTHYDDVFFDLNNVVDDDMIAWATGE